jgi:TolB protein
MVQATTQTFRLFLTLTVLLFAAPAAGQEGSEIIGRVVKNVGGFKIAVPMQADPGTDRESVTEMVDAIRQDLLFDGRFDVIDPQLYGLVPPEKPDEVRHDDWLQIDADFLLRPLITVVGERIDLEVRLYSNRDRTVVLARRYGGQLSYKRRVAHTLANEIIEQLTGSKGIATTRIAFVSRHTGDAKEVYLMDYDGHRVRRLTTTGTINLSPVWSPRGNELAFLSWRGKQPGVYAISAEGELGHFRTRAGELTAAPEWSPDAARIVYSSDADGNAELYLLDRNAGRNTRLTNHPAIDTAPAFSPNGREVAFTSDRSGGPQIYVMDVAGANVRRISWEGSYNESAAWSPKGDELLWVSRIGGRFEILRYDIETEETVQLTHGAGNNENPRWSPDGRHIVFSSDRRGGYQIYTMRRDGTAVRRLTRGEPSYTPDWSR